LAARAPDLNKGIAEIDLQPELCTTEFQQPDNDPMAGVDFVSENEILSTPFAKLAMNSPVSRRDDPARAAPQPPQGPMAPWRDDGDSSNIVASLDAAVRTFHGGMVVQVGNLKGVNDGRFAFRRKIRLASVRQKVRQ
jgi:hypothetical protein